MDLSALATMKNAANCETWCELHSSWIIQSLNALCTLWLLSQGILVWVSKTTSPPFRGEVDLRLDTLLMLWESLGWPAAICVVCVVSLKVVVIHNYYVWKVSVWNLTDYWDNILTIVCRFHEECEFFVSVDWPRPSLEDSLSLKGEMAMASRLSWLNRWWCVSTCKRVETYHLQNWIEKRWTSMNGSQIK